MVVVAIAATVGGCANPEQTVGFTEYDNAARLRAVRAAAASGDQSAVPALIARLSSDDPAERLLANSALERLTGTTMGYQHAVPPDQRQAAIDRWNQWARQHAVSAAGEVTP